MKIFNTMAKEKQELEPIIPKKVGMYACGPTVYNYFHIGNARPLIVFDVLRRYLEFRGYEVKFVQNFTDIDDKMIKKANEEGITVAQLADRFIKEYETDARGLGVREATIHPKATESMDAIIGIISTLIEKGYAYPSNGDVYYRTGKFSEYGKLSHQPLEDLESGARIDVNETKEAPMDFALWKGAKPNEPFWESPWGKGRPGWHIECSAMAKEFLGDTIDIHCGGQDLIFPHHENEIAQSEAANGCEFAKYWMHNGFINVDNQKMSKSTGNFFTVRDVANKYGYDPIRFMMLSVHYRSPMNYSLDIIEQAKTALERIDNCRKNLVYAIETETNSDENETPTIFEERKAQFIEAMDDDLNTADAISAIFELVRDINILIANNASKEILQKALSVFDELCGVLGIASAKEIKSLDAQIEELIEKRQQARKNKDFKTSDTIRDELKAKGVVLEDTPQGVKWRIEG